MKCFRCTISLLARSLVQEIQAANQKAMQVTLRLEGTIVQEATEEALLPEIRRFHSTSTFSQKRTKRRHRDKASTSEQSSHPVPKSKSSSHFSSSHCLLTSTAVTGYQHCCHHRRHYPLLPPPSPLIAIPSSLYDH